MQTRMQVLDRLRKTRQVDVLIIGGGINGIGLFRDLAAQGVPSLLVEQSDFCSGTSAAPSRLAHGGLRYLETGEFSLVRESVEERDLLLLNAPHLVVPLEVWVPVTSLFAGVLAAPLRFFKILRTPGPKGALVLKLGLSFYDWFARHSRVLPRHRIGAEAEARRLMPSFARNVRAVAQYYDARIVHPERLATELLVDAEADCPDAMAMPYLAAERHLDGRVLLRDAVGGEEFEVAPRLVVNASGAWADRVNARLGIDERLVGGTRGSHLIVRNEALAEQLGRHMIYFETSDHRACLAYGLRDDLVLIGTTDIPSDDPDQRTCTSEEVTYLFGELRAVLPGIALDPSQIVLTYSGVRPLPRADESATGAISRDHSSRHFAAGDGRPFPVITLIGGKWTTYRACAEQLADEVLRLLGRRRRQSTRRLPIGGGRNWQEAGGATGSLAGEVARRAQTHERRGADLVERYGTRALEFTVAGDQDHRLRPLPEYSHQEIAHIVRTERVTRLADLVLRRTLIAFHGLATMAVLHELAEVAGGILGWSRERRRKEVDATKSLLSRDFGVKFDDHPLDQPEGGQIWQAL